jgi:hypothetical protein
MRELTWTLAALASLGGTAAADVDSPRASDAAAGAIAVQGSHRGVAQDYLVLPRGGELTAQMRFFTADGMFGEKDELKFTDLALFGLSGRWSLFSKLELGASVELLPKQPSTTDEKPWQSVGVSARSPLGKHVALQISGGGGHLLGSTGKWVREGVTLDLKKQIHPKFLAFDVQAGVNGLSLDKPGTSSRAFITEAAISTTVLFHDPQGHAGAWVGIGYAVPVQSSGRDPTTDLRIDPQPRMNFHMGTVLSAVKKWDIYFDVAVIDRGDLSNPATRLPILDGGFDQKQIVFGVTRRIDRKPSPPRYDSYDDDGNMRLGSL